MSRWWLPADRERPAPLPFDWRAVVAGRWFAVLAATVVAVATLPRVLASPGVDVSWFLYVAGRMLEGDRLYVDLIELNPPLIVWLNLPVAWVARWTGWPAALLYHCAIIMAACGSLLLSGGILRLVKGPSDPVVRRLLLLLFAIVLLPLADGDFGQREHLLLILVLPYLFVAAIRREGTSVTPAFGLVVGVLAGIGVALKPYFVLLPVAVELGRRRIRLREVMRPETLAIVAVAVGYLVAVQVCAASYWPLTTALGPAYRQFVRQPLLATALASEGAAVAICALLAAVALRHRTQKRALTAILLLATIALYAAAVLQQKGWRYHFYPSVGTGLLLLALLSVRMREPTLSVAGRVYQAVSVAVVLYVPSLLMGSAAFRLADLHSLPASRADYAQMVDLVRREAPTGSLLALSSDLAAGFPLVLETGTRWGSRLPSVWVLGAVYQKELASVRPLVYRSPEEKGELERFATHVVIEDLENGRPDLLLVTRPEPDRWEWGSRRFDFIRYFDKEPRFRALFKEYDYLTDVGDYRVFKRVRSGEARRPPPEGHHGRGAPPITALKPGLYVESLDTMSILKSCGFLVLVGVLIFTLPYAESRCSQLRNGR